jgi:hypothetical protein
MGLRALDSGAMIAELVQAMGMSMASKTTLGRLLMLEAIRHPTQIFVVYDEAELARKRARYPSALIIHVVYAYTELEQLAEDRGYNDSA